MKKLWLLMGQVGFWLCWPGLWLYLHGSQRSRVLLFDSSSRVLVVKGWLSTQKWSLPGGGCHGKEDAKEAAIRETAEEVGLSLQSSELRLLAHRPIRSKGFVVDTWLYAATIQTPTKTRPQPFEIIEIAWIDPANLSAENAEPDVLLALEAWSASGSLLQ